MKNKFISHSRVIYIPCDAEVRHGIYWKTLVMHFWWCFVRRVSTREGSAPDSCCKQQHKHTNARTLTHSITHTRYMQDYCIMEEDKHRNVRSSTFDTRVSGAWKLNMKHWRATWSIEEKVEHRRNVRAFKKCSSIEEIFEHWEIIRASVKFDRIELDGFARKSNFQWSLLLYTKTLLLDCLKKR